MPGMDGLQLLGPSNNASSAYAYGERASPPRQRPRLLMDFLTKRLIAINRSRRNQSKSKPFTSTAIPTPSSKSSARKQVLESSLASRKSAHVRRFYKQQMVHHTTKERLSHHHSNPVKGNDVKSA